MSETEFANRTIDKIDILDGTAVRRREEGALNSDQQTKRWSVPLTVFLGS